MQPRYIFVNGVMQINPAYQADGTQAAPQAAPVQNPALAIVSSPAHIADAMQAQQAATGAPMVVAPTTVQSMQMMQDPAFLARFNAPQPLDGSVMLDGLTNIFSRYEIPVGMMHKLMALSQFHLNFMIDDSGSMASETDAPIKEATKYIRDRYDRDGHRARHNKNMTRWEEAQDRLHVIIDMLQYVPVLSIKIHFLNNPLVLTLQQQGHMPADFVAEAHKAVLGAFDQFKQGGTPIYGKLKQAFECAEPNTMHYLFTDGEPSDASPEEVTELMVKRRHPELHPLTLVTCTNSNEADWMKDAEAKAKYASEIDDYRAEKKEVQSKQGKTFPFSRGFWLICQLVAAINPYDLDALDEKYPMTKKTMNELMGRVLTPEEYNYYFTHHPRRDKFMPKFAQFAREDIIAYQIIKPERNVHHMQWMSMYAAQPAQAPAAVPAPSQPMQPRGPGSYGQY